MHAIMTVAELPPRLFISSCVSLRRVGWWVGGWVGEWVAEWGAAFMGREAAATYLELRKGTCGAPSARATMHWPRHCSDLLMLAPSFSRVPVAPVWPTRSLPARSTRRNRDTLRTMPAGGAGGAAAVCGAAAASPSAAAGAAPPSAAVAAAPAADDDGTHCCSLSVNTAWLREECAFILVAAVARRMAPRRSTCARSSMLAMSLSVAPRGL